MTEKNHGGSRLGAGRPKKNRNPPKSEAVFETAEDYLTAVVQGRAAADPVRVQAAKCLIVYQKTKMRAPVKNPTPTQLVKAERCGMESTVAEEFEAKAAEIRARHGKKEIKR